MKSMMMRSALSHPLQMGDRYMQIYEVTEVALTYHPYLQRGPMNHPSWRQQTCLALSLCREEYDALLSGFAFLIFHPF